MGKYLVVTIPLYRPRGPADTPGAINTDYGSKSEKRLIGIEMPKSSNNNTSRPPTYNASPKDPEIQIQYPVYRATTYISAIRYTVYRTRNPYIRMTTFVFTVLKNHWSVLNHSNPIFTRSRDPYPRVADVRLPVELY